MRSIRFKITAITIAAILISMLAVLTAVYSTFLAESDRRSVETLNLIGGNTQKSLEQYLASIEQSVEMAANLAGDSLDGVVLVENGVAGRDADPAARIPEQIARMDEYLAEHCDRIQDAFASVANHTLGVVTYYYCLTPDVSQQEHGFFYSRLGKTGFTEQPPLDARELDPADTEHTTWYYTPIQRGRPSWVGPYAAPFLEELWTYSYLVPIYKAGTLVGVLGMDIPFSTLTDQIRDIRVYDTGYAFLADVDGRILYHPNLPAGSRPDGVGVAGLDQLLREDASGDRLIRYRADGQERQMSFSTLSNGMKLIVTVPTREINASGIRLSRIILGVTVGVLLVFTAVMMLTMHLLTRPLQRLTVASRELAAGDFDAVLDYKGHDEVGALTEAFSQMRDQQKQYIADLNHQVDTDNLTGLPNMRRFLTLAEEERHCLQSAGRFPATLYFNVVGMKFYNRQYGFEAGDHLLREFAGILRDEFGARCVCRYGDDHFAVITAEDSAREQLENVFARCRAAAGRAGAPRPPVRAGVYPYRIEETDVNIACDRARFAGDQGRGSDTFGVSWFTEDMLRRHDSYHYILDHLDQALSEGWVQVYYQPIVRAADGKVCDEEALARWIDPVRGFLSPADFIPALEESKLIYRLDLYMVEQVLRKMKRQAAEGLYQVSQSINLSRADFEACDIVEEVRRRVDEAGIDRALISVEITESIIGSDFEFMKEQVARFRALGFPVWMDDFGSGYSSLDVLQDIHFDLLKFDMRFMQNFGQSEESRIILTELTRMAISLGLETICEGVETAEQAEFLREIGCTKIQGYYYGRPKPFEEILQKYREGGGIGFENPEETDYYTALGRINLYDMSILADEDEESMRRYFNTLPMALMEVCGSRVNYVRCNQSYRDFLQRAFAMTFFTEAFDYTFRADSAGSVFMAAVLRCSRDGQRAVVDEKVGGDTIVHTLVRRVAVNPVTGTTAIAVAVLAAVQEGGNAGMNYAHIAKALSADYVHLYYVDMSTEKFVEYSPDPVREDLAIERHGDSFFAAAREDARTHVWREDQDEFISAFTRENIEAMLDAQGTFTTTYRLLMNDAPVWVSMKAIRMQGDRSHVIIGVSNVDTQMREREALRKIEEERGTYARFNALMQGCVCIYTVDPETGRYMEYSATEDYAGLGVQKSGDDFFAQSRKESVRLLYPEDLEKFQTMMTRERILEEIAKNGSYTIQYRMMVDGEPRYYSAKAVLSREKEGTQIIIGVNDIDAQVRREQDYERKLSAARARANLDTLTGVKNRTAYENMSENLSRQIADGQAVRYAIILCRVEDLAGINEREGRDAGDRVIREACALICETFKHSPVFRVTGDQFAAIAQGHDYENAEDLMRELEQKNHQNRESGGVVMACGMAKYEGEGSVAAVFARAEAWCRRQEG